MAVSIFHRVTGDGLAIAGTLALLWWLGALASGPEAYRTFVDCAASPLGIALLVALSWAFFQHMFSGLRHLMLDTGAGYELSTNKRWSIIVFVAAIAATALFWWIVWGGLPS